MVSFNDFYIPLRYDTGTSWLLHIFCYPGWKWVSASKTAWNPCALGWQICQWSWGQLWAAVGKFNLVFLKTILIIYFNRLCTHLPSCVILDIWTKKDCGVHLPHRFLHQYCGCTVGWPDHLQDKEKLCLPARNEVSHAEQIQILMSEYKKAWAEGIFSKKRIELPFCFKSGIKFSYSDCLRKLLLPPSCLTAQAWMWLWECIHSSKLN